MTEICFQCRSYFIYIRKYLKMICPLVLRKFGITSQKLRYYFTKNYYLSGDIHKPYKVFEWQDLSQSCRVIHFLSSFRWWVLKLLYTFCYANPLFWHHHDLSLSPSLTLSLHGILWYSFWSFSLSHFLCYVVTTITDINISDSVLFVTDYQLMFRQNIRPYYRIR